MLAQKRKLRSTCRSPTRTSSTATSSPASTCSTPTTTTRQFRSTASGGPASRCAPATSSTSICGRPGPTRWSTATSTTSPAPPASTSRTGRHVAAVAARSDADAGLPRQHGRSAYRLRAARRHRLCRPRRHGALRPHQGRRRLLHPARHASPATSDWGFAMSAGTGYLFTLDRQEKIIDRFFLGGDNLRGFQTGGAGPQRCLYRRQPGRPVHLDAVDRAALSAADLARSRPDRPRVRRRRRAVAGHNSFAGRSDYGRSRHRASAPASASRGRRRSASSTSTSPIRS